MRTIRGRIALALTALAAAIGTCGGAASAVEITSSGPLTRIGTSPDLNCYVNHQLDVFSEFYGQTACGSFVAVDGQLYGPQTVPAGFYEGDGMHTPWTPLEQSAVSGEGSRTNPLQVTTNVSGGPLTLRQVDRYVIGEESFRTDVTITNSSDQPRSLIFYRAGDCYLGNSDYGYGRVDGDAISCLAANADGSKGERIEQFLPITAGSHYFHNHYSTVWQQLRNQTELDDSCACDSHIDNGAALSWSRTLAPGESATISAFLTFSPVGVVPVVIKKLADRDRVDAGGAVGYTVAVVNPNVRDVRLTSLTDRLPAGASYVPGSSSGDITADPIANADGSITWSGPFTVPAEGMLRLHYTIRVPDRAGTYRNSVVGEGVDITVVPAEDEAPIDVEDPPAPPTIDVSKISDSLFDRAGERNGYWITVTNPNDVAIALDSIVDRLPPEYVYRPGSTDGVTTADPQISGRTLTWGGGFLIGPRAAIKLHFRVRTADRESIDPNFATVVVSPLQPTPAPAPTPVPTPGPEPQPLPAGQIEVKPAVRSAFVHLLKKSRPIAVRLLAPPRVRTGARVPIRVRTANPGRLPALAVRTCLQLPRGLALRGTGGRRVCRTLSRLGPQRRSSFTVVATATSAGLARLVADATARERRTVRTRGAVRVITRPPAVTG